MPTAPLQRRLLFRLLAVLLGLSPVLVAEITCRINGWGVVAEAQDPFVGFADQRPLFVLNAPRDRFEVDPARQAYFRPDSFAARKGEGEYRIFCLGGSTVQGRPYAIETSFTSWLELSLRAADQSRDWQVVNCGGVSYASYRLAPIMRELLDYQPDLFIVYTGHNEFLEDRTYQEVKQTSLLVTQLHGWSSRWRFYNVCRQAWLAGKGAGEIYEPPAPGARPKLALEVDALLDYRGGLDDYHRNDDWHRNIKSHYEFNLHRMVAMANQAGVPLILVNPTSNLKDCPPFKFTNSEQLTKSQLVEFDQLWEAAKAESDLDRRTKWLLAAIEIDGRHAGAHYLLGHTLLSRRMPDLARRSFARAVDEDVCPLRMTSPLYHSLERVVKLTRTPLVDVRGEFEQRSPDLLTGDKMLLDHIHPTISGHQLIADLLVAEMTAQGLVAPRSDWRQVREPLFREHLASLDAIYYAHGKQRLEGLIRWTQGRADKLKPNPATGKTDNARSTTASSTAPAGETTGLDRSGQNEGSRSTATVPGNGESNR